MTTTTTTPKTLEIGEIVQSARAGLIVAVVMAVVAAIFLGVLKPVIAEIGINETVMETLAKATILLLPFAAYVTCGSAVREIVRKQEAPRRAVITALIATAIVFVLISAGQFGFKVGPFAKGPSIEATLTAVENGTLVELITSGGAAEEAGLQAGDVITAIRSKEVELEEILEAIDTTEIGRIIRFRILRDGEELEVRVAVSAAVQVEPVTLIVGFVIALIVATIGIFWPGGLLPYVLLLLLLSPLLIGYLWLVIATFSFRTQGLLPLDGQDNIGGFTLDNWSFLSEPLGTNPPIWTIALNTLVIAVAMTVIVVLVSSMAGYALSRMNFRGRRVFLSFTLILHGFPAITLLIAIFFVLRAFGRIPIVGDLIGFNTWGGIALVMVAFELPLGVWLMKGFFDGIPWDMERSALIDGASRWRTFYEMMLPQIRPGLLALGIFAFISGWNAYIIPATYSFGNKVVTLSVFLNQLRGDSTAVNFNMVAAVGLFQLIPIMVFFIFAQEYLLNIYAGGSKGSS